MLAFASVHSGQLQPYDTRDLLCGTGRDSVRVLYAPDKRRERERERGSRTSDRRLDFDYPAGSMLWFRWKTLSGS